MKTTDGFTLATAAAALLVSAPGMAGLNTNSNNPDDPVKISVCKDVPEAEFTAISSGNDNFSAVMCQVLGGSAETALTAKPDTDLLNDSVQVAYCNDVFTCAGMSACKGNANDSCAGQNTCHGIGFVGVYSDSEALSAELCEKLGGTLLSSL